MGSVQQFHALSGLCSILLRNTERSKLRWSISLIVVVFSLWSHEISVDKPWLERRSVDAHGFPAFLLLHHNSVHLPAVTHVRQWASFSITFRWMNGWGNVSLGMMLYLSRYFGFPLIIAACRLWLECLRAIHSSATHCVAVLTIPSFLCTMCYLSTDIFVASSISDSNWRTACLTPNYISLVFTISIGKASLLAYTLSPRSPISLSCGFASSTWFIPFLTALPTGHTYVNHTQLWFHVPLLMFLRTMKLMPKNEMKERLLNHTNP